MSDSETAPDGEPRAEQTDATSSAAPSSSGSDAKGSSGSDAKGSGPADVTRRTFFESASNIAMGTGLVSGYGAFFVIAGKYLYPTRSGLSWLMVGPIDKIEPGSAVSFESPVGESVVIRRAKGGPTDPEKPETEFLALSSVCPHLGCRVLWEPQNNRFFCPCHNGVFSPDGAALEGPPAAEGQSLPDYTLMVRDGLLFIEMLSTRVGV